MNSIQKQKSWLIAVGIALFVLAAVSLVFGIILTVGGISKLTETSGIIKLIFGIILVLVAVLFVPTGIKCVWVGSALKATTGSIKMGNIAKEGGTVNMKKCDKCGTEIKEGETACSNCGKPYSEWML